jgi:hypothetical protein
MAGKIFSFFLISFLCLSLFVSKTEKSYAGSNEDLTPEKLIATHVKSIGDPAILATVQSRMFVGSTNVDFIQGYSSGTLKGNALFISEGPKLGIVLKYPDINYPGEYFAYDGKDVTVGHIQPGQKSPIADFIFRFNKVMKGGLLGGVMSASWPLLDITKKNVVMKYHLAKIDGRQLHDLEYHPKEGFGDMKIHFYFDVETFQHVRTEYRVKHPDDATMGSLVTMSSQEVRPDSFYTLIEKFEDYKKVGPLTLPHRYILEYSQEGVRSTFIAHWTLNVDQWGFNAKDLDQKFFQAQK